MHKHAAHAVALAILALGITTECISGAAVGKDVPREIALTTPAAAPTETAFQPLALPPGGVVRGISLSGQGEMQQTEATRYKLARGCAMLHTEAAVTVDAGPAIAAIDTHTTAVVHMDSHVTRFVNLTDHRRHSMRVAFGKHFIELEPGYELVLVLGEGLDPKSTAVQEGIGFKDLHQLCTDHLCVFVFRVSAADIITKCRIYRQLAQSPLEADKALREELLKSAAALETMYNKKSGPYFLDPFQYSS